MTRRIPLAILLAALLAGLGAGLYLGWVALPQPAVEADPSSLHPAFKDDYILMIATAYAGDGDLPAAQTQIASLGFGDPTAAVEAAAARLSAGGLPASDQDRLARLAADLAAAPAP
ncbi:MAG: hypothetical protein IT318_09445 [Anaerolineales bacterium]|nr:hypothetical protein [Anaerolineales bacterium]